MLKERTCIIGERLCKSLLKLDAKHPQQTRQVLSLMRCVVLKARKQDS